MSYYLQVFNDNIHKSDCQMNENVIIGNVTGGTLIGPEGTFCLITISLSFIGRSQIRLRCARLYIGAIKVIHIR